MSRIMCLETLPKIPIVDFSKENLKPGTDSWFPACNNVWHALEEYVEILGMFSLYHSFLISFSIEILGMFRY